MRKICKFSMICILMIIALTACGVKTGEGEYDKNGFLFKKLNDNEYSVSQGRADTKGTFTLPNTFKRKAVTKIDDGAFMECDRMVNIIIPDSITSIGHYAFYSCRILTQITIPNSVTTIGESAFKECMNLTNITLPSRLTSISNDTFAYCYKLKEILIPDSVKSIGWYAFYYCTSLTNITIPSSVTSIASRAFADCSSLTEISLPSSVVDIGNEAFVSCVSLTKISIPEGVTSINEGTFEGCFKLDSVIIPSTVSSIGKKAFHDCKRLYDVTIPSSVTKIGESAFYETGIWENTPLYSVVYVDKWVVSYKGPLDNVTLREDTIGISDNGFFSLNETNLILPLGLKYIGNYAFDGCTAMLSLTIPSSVISMGHCAIFACIKLTIYCEATSQPSGWDSLWNPANRPVVWNYKNN